MCIVNVGKSQGMTELMTGSADAVQYGGIAAANQFIRAGVVPNPHFVDDQFAVMYNPLVRPQTIRVSSSCLAKSSKENINIVNLSIAIPVVF